MARVSRREDLLDAAVTVVRRDGARALTLDAVVAEAGTSKGGLLYHFGSKRALIDAMLERWLDELTERLESSQNMLMAYVEAADLSETVESDNAVEFGLLAALIESPEVLERVRERQARWMACLLDVADNPIDAWLIRLAADGLWYADLLGMVAPTGDTRARIMQRLQELATGAAHGSIVGAQTPTAT